jgi:ubiquinone/menaquinone biosynthesis C-methylase UbiE
MNDNVFAYQRRFLEKIFKCCHFNGREILLDIGCGDGAFSRLLSKYVGVVVGVDIIPDLNWREIGDRNVQFLVADGAILPFINECFDIIFEKDMLHHIKVTRRR